MLCFGAVLRRCNFVRCLFGASAFQTTLSLALVTAMSLKDNVINRKLTVSKSPLPGSCDREDPDETTTGVEMCSLDLKGD